MKHTHSRKMRPTESVAIHPADLLVGDGVVLPGGGLIGWVLAVSLNPDKDAVTVKFMPPSNYRRHAFFREYPGDRFARVHIRQP